jgi:superfamily II DNA or RNA helicase
MNQERLAELERLLRIAEDDLSNLLRHKEFLLDQVASLKRERENLLHPVVEESPAHYSGSWITTQSREEAKIRIFRALFRGREDVYARRFESRKTDKSGYQPDCKNEWLADICLKPKIKCSDCDHRQFIPVTDAVIRNHLMGRDPADLVGRDFTIGVYPLLPDETCWFLAVDFDKSAWREDAQAFRHMCGQRGIPASLERSRSGNGAHVWIFFSEPVPARLARSLGSFLLTETIERRPEISLKSYDRLFPSQDTLPQRGFGNLIALPLQRRPRDSGNSVFLNENVEPYADQWSYLSSIRRLAREEVEQLVQKLSRSGHELGPRSAFVELTDEAPWEQKRFSNWKELEVHGPLPDKVNLSLVNQLYIPKQGLSPSLCNRIIRMAVFPNPEFQRAQAMRLSTYGKPRMICCAEDFPDYIALPRGCLGELLELLQALGVSAGMDDRRTHGSNLQVQFHGELNELQTEAAEALLKHETGVLVAPTAFGKTVVGAWLIARRQVNTLVLVHTRQLMDQWVNRLDGFLKPQPGTIGQIGAGKDLGTGLVDVGILQSLVHKCEVNPLVEQYGQIIVDECHHISARSFEQVARAAKACYVTGFSATVERRDGHHPIIFMQCGPVRHRVTVERQQTSDHLTRAVRVRKTGFLLPDALAQLKSLTIHDVYEGLIHDEQRNQMIVADALSCLERGCCPLVLTERRDHLGYLAQCLGPVVSNLVILTGGMGQKQRKAAMSSLHQEGSRLVLATGRYLGEGFDDDRLDTLLLAMPISWKGTLAQYAGRLNRTRHGKHEVTIYDYADLEVPMLRRMFQRRLRGYKQLGYVTHETA